MFRVRFEEDPEHKGIARHFVTLLDYRVGPKETQTERIEANNREDWLEKLRQALRKVEKATDNVPLEQRQKQKEVEIVIMPHPGDDTLREIKDEIKKVFPNVNIVECKMPRQ